MGKRLFDHFGTTKVENNDKTDELNTELTTTNATPQDIRAKTTSSVTIKNASVIDLDNQVLKETCNVLVGKALSLLSRFQELFGFNTEDDEKTLDNKTSLDNIEGDISLWKELPMWDTTADVKSIEGKHRVETPVEVKPEAPFTNKSSETGSTHHDGTQDTPVNKEREHFNYYAPTPLRSHDPKIIGQSSWHQRPQLKNRGESGRLWKRFRYWLKAVYVQEFRSSDQESKLGSMRREFRGSRSTALALAASTTRYIKSEGSIRIKKPGSQHKSSKNREDSSGVLAQAKQWEKLEPQEVEPEKNRPSGSKAVRSGKTAKWLSKQPENDDTPPLKTIPFCVSIPIGEPRKTTQDLKKQDETITANNDPSWFRKVFQNQHKISKPISILGMDVSSSDQRAHKTREAKLKLEIQQFRNEEPIHFETCKQVYEELDDLMRGLKLYYDVRCRGERVQPYKLYFARFWRNERFVEKLGRKERDLLFGDGVMHRFVPMFIDFDIVDKWTPLKTWTREVFKPVFIVPRLEGMIATHDTSCVLRLFVPLLRICKQENFPESRGLFYEDVLHLKSKYTNKEMLNWRLKSDNRELSSLILFMLKSYASEFYNTFRYSRRHVKGNEDFVNRVFSLLLDDIVLGYFEAFHISTNMRYLKDFGSNKIYARMYAFFNDQEFKDYGFELLKYLSKHLYRLSGKSPFSPSGNDGKNSIEFLNDCLVSNGNDYTNLQELCYLILMCSLIQSKNVQCFILRRLLFMVDQSQNTEFNRNRWFLDCERVVEQSFRVKTRMMVRDEILREIAARAADN